MARIIGFGILAFFAFASQRVHAARQLLTPAHSLVLESIDDHPFYRSVLLSLSQRIPLETTQEEFDTALGNSLYTPFLVQFEELKSGTFVTLNVQDYEFFKNSITDNQLRIIAKDPQSKHLGLPDDEIVIVADLYEFFAYGVPNPKSYFGTITEVLDKRKTPSITARPVSFARGVTYWNRPIQLTNPPGASKASFVNKNGSTGATTPNATPAAIKWKSVYSISNAQVGVDLKKTLQGKYGQKEGIEIHKGVESIEAEVTKDEYHTKIWFPFDPKVNAIQVQMLHKKNKSVGHEKFVLTVPPYSCVSILTESARTR